jgi:Leucine-rich repeat (LRR) protein
MGLPSGLAGSVDVRLEDLRELTIQSGGLTVVPPDVMGLTGLELLDLSFNPLVSLPPELAGLTGLRTLRLAGVGLTGFPAEIARLTGLASLTLDGNLLGALPPDVGDLVNLTDLSLRRTGLTDLPGELAGMTQLENLQLADNQLSQWPPVLQLLPQLRYLCLAGNGLTGLETLVLCDNRLTALPHQLGRLREDLALNLRYNPLAKPLPELAERGVSALFAYLRGLEGARTQYEAKVLPDGVTAHVERGLASSRGEAGLSPAEGAGLRALRAMLLRKDVARFFGGLRRVQAPTDLLWVCTNHLKEYDPGLTKLPAS